jgi:hypothetical protein
MELRKKTMMTQKQVQEVLKEMRKQEAHNLKMNRSYELRARKGKKEYRNRNIKMAKWYHATSETWYEAWKLLLVHFNRSRKKA